MCASRPVCDQCTSADESGNGNMNDRRGEGACSGDLERKHATGARVIRTDSSSLSGYLRDMGRCSLHVFECCSVKVHQRSAHLGCCGVVHTMVQDCA